MGCAVGQIVVISHCKTNRRHYFTMKIGNIDLGERPVMLAPMEDVTDQSFRLICREQGADLVYTEFVSADALIRSIERSFQKMAIAPGERPAAIQIYGRDVDSMVEAVHRYQLGLSCEENCR